jgi:hypothetical protein
MCSFGHDYHSELSKYTIGEKYFMEKRLGGGIGNEALKE